jgi:hypothetical protein
LLLKSFETFHSPGTCVIEISIITQELISNIRACFLRPRQPR